MCRMHAIAMDYEMNLDDPIGSLIEGADRFLSQQKDGLVSEFARTLGQILSSNAGANPSLEGFARAAAESARVNKASAPPPKPVPPPAPPKESPRDVLGFDPKTKLTKAMVKERQRTLAKLWHPDHGGSTKALQRLNAAVAEILPTLK